MDGFPASSPVWQNVSMFGDEMGYLVGLFGGKLANFYLYICWPLQFNFFHCHFQTSFFFLWLFCRGLCFRWRGESHSSRHMDVTTHLCKNRTNASLPRPLPSLSFALSFPPAVALFAASYFSFAPQKPSALISLSISVLFFLLILFFYAFPLPN